MGACAATANRGILFASEERDSVKALAECTLYNLCIITTAVLNSIQPARANMESAVARFCNKECYAERVPYRGTDRSD